MFSHVISHYVFYVPFPDPCIVFVFFKSFLAQTEGILHTSRGHSDNIKNVIFSKEFDTEDI